MTLSRRYSRQGLSTLVFVVCLVTILGVLVYAMNLQRSAVQRHLVRTIMKRTCLEAAESAFAEARIDIRSSLVSNSPGPVSGRNWKDLLIKVPVSTRPSENLVSFTPKHSKEIFETRPYDLTLSDVSIGLIKKVDQTQVPLDQTLVRLHGVLEFRIGVKTGKGKLDEKRRVLQRYQFYATYNPSRVDVNTISRSPQSNPLSPANSDVILLNVPLGTTIQ